VRERDSPKNKAHPISLLELANLAWKVIEELTKEL
jgi:hypothetical protein